MFLIGVTMTAGVAVGCFLGSSTLPKRLTPGVHVSSIGLTRTLFAQLPDLHWISDVRRGALHSGSGTDVVVSSYDGAVFLDREGHRLGEVSFEVGSTFPLQSEIVDVDADGRCEFWRTSRIGHATGELVAHDGKSLWVTREDVKASSFGDIDADGKVEFLLVGPGGQIELRDSRGRLLWSRERNRDGIYAAIVPRHDENHGTVVLVFKKGSEVLSSEGHKISQAEGELPVWGTEPLAVLPPTDGSGLPQLLFASGRGFVVLNPEGVELLRLAAHGLSEARATWVRFSKESPPYLAIVGMLPEQGAEWIGYEHVWMKLFVYDSAHVLVYEETLEERGYSLATIPTGDGTDRLLVGGENNVWLYGLATDVSSRTSSTSE